MNDKAKPGGQFRGLLTMIGTLPFTSTLSKRLIAHAKPPPATAPLTPADLRDLTPERALGVVEALEPDAAWAFFAKLTEPMQEHIAETATMQRWSELMVREIQAQALARAKPPAKARPVPSRVSAGAFEYKPMLLTCRACGWTGVGDETKVSEMFDSGITEHVCPKCSADIAITTWPTLAEYHAHWAELSELEREYVFRCEQAQQERDGKPSH